MNIAFTIQIGSKHFKRSLGYALVIRHPRPSCASRNGKNALIKLQESGAYNTYWPRSNSDTCITYWTAYLNCQSIIE